jgi:hypothetical protein
MPRLPTPMATREPAGSGAAIALAFSSARSVAEMSGKARCGKI